jgi:hypothetical protein
MKKFSILSAGLIFCLTSFASSIIDQGKGVKKAFDSRPRLVNAAISMTDVNAWAKCGNIYAVSIANEARGIVYEDNHAFFMAVLGESMSRARTNFLSQGYSENSLDSLFRAYTKSGRAADLNEFKFCQSLIAEIAKYY